MTQTKTPMRKLIAAGMLSVFALSLASAPALARGGAGGERIDSFSQSFKAGSSYQERQAKKKAAQAKDAQRASKPKADAQDDGPNFFERLFGADAKDGE